MLRKYVLTTKEKQDVIMSKLGSIFKTQDGSHSLYSEEFGVSYHSKYGAIQESRHVFIEAGLYPILESKSDIRVFEMGFGTGLNAFLCRLVSEKRNKQIYYETVESHPISLDQASVLNYSTCLSELNISNQPEDFLSLHQSAWNKKNELSPNFTFLKWQHRLQEAPLSGQYDVIFYDAFAPESQAELWEEAIISKIVKAMNPGGVFVTYCAKGVFKRLLKSLDLKVEGIPGPPGKREMTRGWKL